MERVNAKCKIFIYTVHGQADQFFYDLMNIRI